MENSLILILLGIQSLLILLLLFKLFRLQSSQEQQQLQQSQLKEEILKGFQQNRQELLQNVTQQFGLILSSSHSQSKEQSEALKDFGRLFRENVQEFNGIQKEKFQDLVNKQERMLAITEERLEKMRATVEEKLQNTLEARLGQSFELVNKQLLAVQKGLGEMQHLATGVGDLKRVLTNVKSRGMMGEYQLSAILENILSPDQYVSNMAVKKGVSERVEFAIKLPGHHSEPVFLPIDAKFPQENYYRLLDAFETGDKTLIQIAKGELAKSLKKSAMDISSKYIHPPVTTDFAIMFLPMESLYAEAIRDVELVQMLQRDYKVVVAGPTTLAAMLNSLQIGFKTLAIQKRSSEVWEVLAQVKTEFSKFGDLIQKAQKKISDAHHDLDELVGTRTRAIQRKLRDVSELPLPDENRREKIDRP